MFRWRTLRIRWLAINEIVAAGDDVDFGKRAELLTSIKKPPFYVLKWGPALLDVFGGALTNAKLNVLGLTAVRFPDYMRWAMLPEACMPLTIRSC